MTYAQQQYLELRAEARRLLTSDSREAQIALNVAAQYWHDMTQKERDEISRREVIE